MSAATSSAFGWRSHGSERAGFQAARTPSHGAGGAWAPSGRSIQRDYTEIDNYDYFNHKTPATAIDKPYFEARTLTDRRVFGGDGIQPDETIKSEKLNNTQARLLDPLFFFAREAVNGRIFGQETYSAIPITFGKRIKAADFRVTENLMAAFNDFAEKRTGGKLTADSLNKESTFIKLRLRYYIVMASYGAVSANQVLIEDDLQVAKAVETLPRAAQLAQLAAKARQNQ